MEDNSIKVYIKTDENNNIIDINSSVFLTDLTDWIEIDEGTGDKYAHAQGHYFDKPLMTETGIYRYQYLYKMIVEKTDKEIAIEEAKLPQPGMSDVELLKAQVKTLSEESELTQAVLLLNQQDIIIKQNEHDEVLAAILLGQQTI